MLEMFGLVPLTTTKVATLFYKVQPLWYYVN
jgi:hypothetical protein